MLAAVTKAAVLAADAPPSRHQHFQVGMKTLELLDRRKISIEGPWIRLAIHAGQVWGLIVGPGIGDNASRGRSGRHVGEGVQQVRELASHTILLQVRNVVAGVVDTPLFEISANEFFLELVSVRCDLVRMKGRCMQRGLTNLEEPPGAGAWLEMGRHGKHLQNSGTTNRRSIELYSGFLQHLVLTSIFQLLFAT